MECVKKKTFKKKPTVFNNLKCSYICYYTTNARFHYSWTWLTRSWGEQEKKFWAIEFSICFDFIRFNVATFQWKVLITSRIIERLTNWLYFHMILIKIELRVILEIFELNMFFYVEKIENFKAAKKVLGINDFELIKFEFNKLYPCIHNNSIILRILLIVRYIYINVHFRYVLGMSVHTRTSQ